jgi:hypothetical protein
MGELKAASDEHKKCGDCQRSFERAHIIPRGQELSENSNDCSKIDIRSRRQSYCIASALFALYTSARCTGNL